MVNMQKMRNQFHRACGYYVGFAEFFTHKATHYVYYLVTTATTEPPLEDHSKNKLDDPS